MPCIKCLGKPSKMQRLEQTAMKNGFRPGVHEKHGLYVGQWINDMKQGKGKKFYKDKTIYEGDWMANKRHGFGVLMKNVDDHYEYVYEGQWIDNRFAKGKWYEKNGVYEGTFSCNKIKCGYGTMCWNDGTVYRGQWRNNVYDGRGWHLEVNGNFYDGKWSNGLKHGEGIYVFKDKGQFMEGVWVYGVPKINMIKYINDYNRDDHNDHDDVTNLSSITQRLEPMIPEMSKFDEENIRKAYDRTKLETLSNLLDNMW